ncbi:MAG: dephospho-CoA kinase [Syntrophales bacterium]|jgi:dephospho-CoA kinase
MNTSRDWGKHIRRLEQLMRLKTFPIAFKLLEKKENMATIPFLRRLGHKSTLCQLLNVVRSFDWTVGADATDLMGPVCTSIIGLEDMPDFMKDGTFRSIIWSRTKSEGQKYENAIPRLPTGKYEAVVMGPAVYNPFDPNIILIYANPAQMMLLINSLQFEHYEVMQFFCVGESSCADAIVRCYLGGKPSLTIPCYGERRYGHTQDDELVMALPSGMLDTALKGMETLYRRGIRYPVSYAGSQMDITPAMPGAYAGAAMLEPTRGKNSLLLGVTGSIATGKSTVSKMLEDLGAPIIDFDSLARVVVEPGKPAYNDILSFFGKQVLSENGTIDRRKLSEILFTDAEKRKALEGFTHPRIGAAYVEMVQQCNAENPDAIIQIVVPLLIEANMSSMFDRILLVYTPEEDQIRRLKERDSIDNQLAANMVQSQMSIEEKKRFADYVIDNSGTKEDTDRQVHELWEALKILQREKASKKGQGTK